MNLNAQILCNWLIFCRCFQTLSLHVAYNNRARHLYERQGFIVAESIDSYAWLLAMGIGVSICTLDPLASHFSTSGFEAYIRSA